MQLSEIKYILNNIDLDGLRLSRTSTANGIGGYNYVFEGLQNFKRQAGLLYTIDYFKPLIDSVVNSGIYVTSEDKLTVDSQTDDKISYAIKLLYERVSSIKDFLLFANVVPEQDRNSLRIKLPPVKDFGDIAQVMNDFKKAISIPIADEDAGEVRIEGAESGSIWFIIYLALPKAARLIGEIVWSATVVQKKIQEIEHAKKIIEEMSIYNDQKNNLVEAQKKLIDTLVSAEAASIHSRLNGGDDKLSPEAHNRLILSIKTTQELLERGAEIKPALSAPEEVTNLFPPSTTDKFIESRIKQIDSGTTPREN